MKSHEIQVRRTLVKSDRGEGICQDFIPLFCLESFWQGPVISSESFCQGSLWAVDTFCQGWIGETVGGNQKKKEAYPVCLLPTYRLPERSHAPPSAPFSFTSTGWEKGGLCSFGHLKQQQIYKYNLSTYKHLLSTHLGGGQRSSAVPGPFVKACTLPESFCQGRQLLASCPFVKDSSRIKPRRPFCQGPLGHPFGKDNPAARQLLARVLLLALPFVKEAAHSISEVPVAAVLHADVVGVHTGAPGLFDDMPIIIKEHPGPLPEEPSGFPLRPRPGAGDC